ncbi:hypothetical protein HYALB_00000875 [Hymenoscyphus albidus]|uniref:DNA-directed RNA polymerase III subunit RPC9 n=1 Tax=Hymenoscyphus albidus TaxID=595503 RepID=A0A9N9LFZ5_9HELO|nr:hypothetical protein HYALB_00000875 [Hymenoscyphus albidus]
MKILEAQSATLTNYEVYTHLLDQEERFASRTKARGPRAPPVEHRPSNLKTVTKELLNYLREAPSPLGSNPLPYNENTIKKLLEGLRPWNFTKGEILMILNLRPSKPENLNTIIEEMESRFPGDEEQEQILNVIGDVLGRPDGKAESKAMAENANKARLQRDRTVAIVEQD